MAPPETLPEQAAASASVLRLPTIERAVRLQRSLATVSSVLVDKVAGKAAVVSSFGAESAVLLALAAEVDRSVPVVFLETGKHFPETLRYRDRLIEVLGLTDVRSIEPAAEELSADDPDGILWASDPDRCCDIRKVRPLERALSEFDAWLTGRKRFQAATRQELAPVEWDGVHVKINPLAEWDRDDIAAFVAARDLPAHSLVAQGFPSIGCMPCTARVAEGEDARSGRWRGQGKTECGIHLRPSRAA
ncbi:phosphoadenosine phosphosulfate reductase [Amorphus suaedae]